MRVTNGTANGDTTWLGLAGRHGATAADSAQSGEWAVAYHGTKHCNLPGILANGFSAVSMKQIWHAIVSLKIYLLMTFSDF